MKNIMNKFFAVVIFIAFSNILFGQKLILKHAETKYDKNTYPCIEVIIEPPTSEVKDAWEDFIKDKYDVKMKGNGFFTNKDVLHADQVKFKVISAKEMDFYTRIVEDGENTKLCVFGSFGYDIPISSREYPAEFRAMESITQRFLKGYLPDFYNDWIKDTEEELSDLQEDQEDMQKEFKENKKEIEKLAERNENLEKKISENGDKIIKTKIILDDKKEAFSEVNTRIQTFRVERSNK